MVEMLACYSDFHGTTDTKLTGLSTEAAKVGCQPLFLSETLWFTANSILNRKAVPSPFTQREFLIPQSGRILLRCSKSGSLLEVGDRWAPGLVDGQLVFVKWSKTEALFPQTLQGQS